MYESIKNFCVAFSQLTPGSLLASCFGLMGGNMDHKKTKSLAVWFLPTKLRCVLVWFISENSNLYLGFRRNPRTHSVCILSTIIA